MATVKNGDTVKVHYTGKFDTGEVFDSSDGADPLAFTVGAGQVIPGFDQALVGMQIGETKDIVIEPEQAYGNRVEELFYAGHLRCKRRRGIAHRGRIRVDLFGDATLVVAGREGR